MFHTLAFIKIPQFSLQSSAFTTHWHTSKSRSLLLISAFITYWLTQNPIVTFGFFRVSHTLIPQIPNCVIQSSRSTYWRTQNPIVIVTFFRVLHTGIPIQSSRSYILAHSKSRSDLYILPCLLHISIPQNPKNYY